MEPANKQNHKSLSRMNGVDLAFIIAIVTLVGGLVLSTHAAKSSNQNGATSNQNGTGTIKVTATKAAIATHSPSFKLLGKVRSVNEAKLSSPVAGVVATISVREGEPVAKGQILVSLDPIRATLLLEQQQSISKKIRAELKELELAHLRNQKNLGRLKEVLRLSEKRLQREATLLAESAGAQAQHDRERQNVLAEQIQVDDLQHQISSHPQRQAMLLNELRSSNAKAGQLALDLERLTLLAPFNGVIDQRLVAQGERVNANQSIISLYDSDNLEVVANLPNRYQEAINQAMAQQQSVTGKVPNSDITLTLDYVGQIIGDGELAQKGYFKINGEGYAPLIHNSVLLFDIVLPDQQAIARPGMAGEIPDSLLRKLPG